MPNPDFGPVPVSQLKTESARIFAALGDDRRVLISRRGQVVAAIEPASVERFAEELAAFALPKGGPLAELSASDLSQGSPSEAVRAAEQGSASYVTRNNKVYGVLGALPSPRAAGAPAYARWVADREAALVEFERANPDASAEDFAAAVASYPDPPVTAAASASGGDWWDTTGRGTAFDAALSGPATTESGAMPHVELRFPAAAGRPVFESDLTADQAAYLATLAIPAYEIPASDEDLVHPAAQAAPVPDPRVVRDEMADQAATAWRELGSATGEPEARAATGRSDDEGEMNLQLAVLRRRFDRAVDEAQRAYGMGLERLLSSRLRRSRAARRADPHSSG